MGLYSVKYVTHYVVGYNDYYVVQNIYLLKLEIRVFKTEESTLDITARILPLCAAL